MVAAVGDADGLLDAVTEHTPTCASSTCGCRRPTPTKACGRRSRSAGAIRTSRCSCSPSTSRSGTPASCSTGDVAGVGYLLKDRVIDVDDFLVSLRRVANGGSAIDAEVVSQILGRSAAIGDLDRLTPREREVLTLMAEGLSNGGIADRLVVSHGAVEKHISNVFMKLGLDVEESGHRRVLAVLTYLRGS